MNGNTANVSLRGIRKRFETVEALRGVDFDAFPGTVNAIIGENGAGKTTLMKVLFGLLRPDSGNIVINGETVPPGHNPRRAIALGIGMLQQHSGLVPAFTALENIILGCEPARGVKLDIDTAQRQVSRILIDLGSKVRPDTPVNTLSVSERQQVEIARMLYTGAEILIFDEPTATLAPQEAGRLYELLRRLAQDGKTIIVITHRLAEVLTHADNVTVLRRGLVTAEFRREKMAEDSLIGAIVPGMQDRGRLETRRPLPFDGDAKPALELKDVACVDSTGRGILRKVDLEIRPGEILAMAGVTGSGQLELAETIIGVRRPAAGKILINGNDITEAPTGSRRSAGLVYIPEDRLADGVIPQFSLCLNRLLGDHRLPRFYRGWRYNMPFLLDDVLKIIEEYDIDAPGPDSPLAVLSGGNQQKLMLAREFERAPKVIIANVPTRGLDLIASRRCYDRLLDLCSEGAAAMLFSTELDDLLTYSHRVAVLFGGKLVPAGDSKDLEAKEVGLLMTRGKIEAA